MHQTTKAHTKLIFVQHSLLHFNFTEIVNNNLWQSKLFLILSCNFQRAPVLEAWVGLRPGRPSVRLEKEVRKFKDKFGRERNLKVSNVIRIIYYSF